jgi:hypothetical protein
MLFQFRIGGRRRTRGWLKHAEASVAKKRLNEPFLCDTLGSQYSPLRFLRAAGAW